MISNWDKVWLCVWLRKYDEKRNNKTIYTISFFSNQQMLNGGAKATNQFRNDQCYSGFSVLNGVLFSGVLISVLYPKKKYKKKLK